MRKISTLLIVAATVCACGKKTDNTLADLNLKGKVKSMSAVSYFAEEKFGKIEKTGVSGNENTRTSFNEKGYVTEVSNYDMEGNIAGRLFYKYDDKDRQTEALTYLPDGTLISRNIIEYDGKDIKSITSYTAADSLLNRTRVENEGGKPVRYEVFGGDDKLLAVRTIEYDKGGYMSQESFRDVIYDLTTTIEYTRKGNLVMARKETQGNNMMNVEYEYDSHDNPMKMKLLDSEGGEDILYVDYKYDEKGNWISQTLLRGETRIPIEIVERTYEYYQ